MSSQPKILVVEDEDISRQIIINYLESAGYVVVNANDGMEAWECLTQSAHNFSIVITDRVMPRMDGIELAEKMRTHPIFANTPVIMLTSAAEKDEVLAAVRGGVFDFLIKPIEKDLLLMVVKRALVHIGVFF